MRPDAAQAAETAQATIPTAPGPVLPCGFILQGMPGSPPGIVGAAVVYRDGIGTPAVNVVATLPHPSLWGD